MFKLLYLPVGLSDFRCLFEFQSAVIVHGLTVHKYPAVLGCDLCSSQFIDGVRAIIVNCRYISRA